MVVSNSTARPVKVDVWSDVACPWCFIGKRRFKKALAAWDGPVEVEFHSFELSPDTPVDFEGGSEEFFARYKGWDAEQVRAMHAQITEIAAAEGLSYDLAAVRHTNTRLAHEALHFAKEHGLQSELKERLLSAHFEQGRHLGRVDELVSLAEEIGLDGPALREALDSGRHAAAVQADVDRARAYGIAGVPFFVFDGRIGVSGAQAPETFVDVLHRAARDATPGAGR